MSRKTILIVMGIVLLAALVGTFLYYKPTPDLVNRKPDVKLTVGTLIAAFEEDTATATKQYLDKILEVTGRIKQIDTAGALVLGEVGVPSEVVVGLDRRYQQDHRGLTVGDKVVVQGLCSGFSGAGISASDDLLADLGITVQLRSAGVKTAKLSTDAKK